MSEPLATADALLLLIPASVLLGAVAGVLGAVPLSLGLAGGSLPASGALGYALFVDPPTPDGGR